MDAQKDPAQTCRVEEVDGEPVLVEGATDWDDTDRAMFVEAICAAKAAYTAGHAHQDAAAPAVPGLAVPDDRPAAPGPGRVEVDGWNPTDDELRAIAERRTDPAASVADLARLVLREREQHQASDWWSWYQTAAAACARVCAELDATRAEAERHRLAWRSASRDRSKIRHEMWVTTGQRDQARAAAEAFSDVVTDYMLGVVDGRAISRAQTTLHAAIAGDEPPAADVAAIRAEARVDALLDAALDLEDGLLFHCQRAAAEWLRDRAETIRFRAAATAVLCDRCGRPGREHEGELFSCPGPPTHLPLSEVLELAADLARRAATPPDHGSGT